MKTRLVPACVFLLLILGSIQFAVAQPRFVQAEGPVQTPTLRTNTPKSNGTPNPPLGKFGEGFDFAGWQPMSGPSGQPRFLSPRASDERAPNSVSLSSISDPGDVYWDNRLSGPPGVSGNVYATAVGPNGEIYVGGDFTLAGTVVANNIAKWNPTTGTWSALGSGTEKGVNGYVFAIAVNGNDIYVGGIFNKAGNIPATSIAKWDSVTGSWSSLGGGIAGGGVGFVSRGWELFILSQSMVPTYMQVAHSLPREAHLPTTLPSGILLQAYGPLWAAGLAHGARLFVRLQLAETISMRVVILRRQEALLPSELQNGTP